MSDEKLGRYTGRLVLLPLSDGRRMQVLEEFGFADGREMHWPVPPLTIVDGASIPSPLWSLIGGPWEGKYRDASVVHDYYCDVRTAPWQSVHRVFFDAMLASGVSAFRAKLMYAAVYFAGPRWSETVEHNMGLGEPAKPRRVTAALAIDALDLVASLERESVEAIHSAIDQPESRPGPIVLNLGRLATILNGRDIETWVLMMALDLAVRDSYRATSREIALGSLEPFD